MQIENQLQYAKVLEDRLNNLEDSYGSGALSSPINVIQARLVDEVEEIGLQYLLNYQTIRLGQAINMGIYASEFFPIINQTEKYKEKKGIPLDSVDDNELVQIIKRRRSGRKYSGKTIPFSVFSNILGGAQNCTKVQEYILRSTPSGGGLYPIDLYFFANRIEDLEQGIYRYYPITQNLEPVKMDCKKDVLKCLENQTVIDVEQCGGVFFFTYDYTKNYQKYGDLAMALGFIETGIIAQTIHLLCTEFHVASCDVGGFDKIFCEEMLGLDGINTHAVYAIVIGGKEDV